MESNENDAEPKRGGEENISRKREDDCHW